MLYFLGEIEEAYDLEQEFFKGVVSLKVASLPPPPTFDKRIIFSKNLLFSDVRFSTWLSKDFTLL